MVKVCHIISGYYRNDARVFQRQCKSLVKGGYQVSLITNDGNPDEVLDGIPIHSCELKWRSRLKVLFFAKYQFYQKALEINADIYQLHSPELLSLGLALKRKGKIVIYDAHEDLPRHILEKEWLPTILRKPIAFLAEQFINKTLAKYDAIISPHTHVVKYLSKINKHVKLIANFPLVSSQISNRGVTNNVHKAVMCYTGTVYQYSNQEEIIDAIEHISGLEYEIAGYISEEHLAELSKRPGFSKVKFLGRIPWEEMQSFYSRMSFGIVVYDYKLNLGYKLGSYGTNKIFEYMEAGIPFICTDYDLWKEIIDKHDCGICVTPGDVEQIRAAINFFIQNPLKANEMGENGRRAVLTEFNWASQEKIYLEIFNQLSNNI